MLKRERKIDLFCQEPFRVFFPVGLVLGAIGVSLWILYYAGITTSYPGVSHARLMIEGFVASFIIGFLGTAGPRLTETPHFSRAELFALLTLDLSAAGLHLGGSNRAGDALFAFCVMFFFVTLARRFVLRQDSPPPNFVLVGLSLLNAITGAGLLALFENEAYSASYRVGAGLLQLGFPLLAILGVAPFLLPRTLNLPAPDDRPGSRAPRWMEHALFALAVGLTIDATFLLETLGLTSPAAWLRLAAIGLYLAIQIPRAGRSFLGDCLRFGLWTIALGFLVEALWPQLRVGALHIVFITGFGLVILTVAIRVIFGHSGYSHLFARRLPFHVVVVMLLSLAMFSRYTADLAPRARSVHLVAAAILWIAAALLWAAKLLPKVLIVEAEE